jgi:hypothetical protein
MNKLIEFLEREAGHLAILLLLVLVGIGVWLKMNDKELVTLSFGALLALLKGNSQPPKPPETKV